MLWLYNLIWYLIHPLLRVMYILDFPASLCLRERMMSGGLKHQTPAIWFHCASLGEAKGLTGLISHLSLPGQKILVTANTVLGLGQLLHDLEHFDPDQRVRVRMAPLDHPLAVRKFVTRYQVKALCLFESELWPNYILVCRKRGYPVFLVSARMSVRALKLYRLAGGGFRRIMNSLSWVQAQDTEQVNRLKVSGARKVRIGADYKAAYYLNKIGPFPEDDVDNTLNSAGIGSMLKMGQGEGLSTEYNPQSQSEDLMPGNASSLNTAENTIAFVSLHLEEFLNLLPVIKVLMERGPIIIFPRTNNEMKQFRKYLEPMGFKRYTRDTHARYLLVDCYGKVSDYLKFCSACFIGGSFTSYGCHNLWEPFLSGVFTISGPNINTQVHLARALVKNNLAVIIRQPQDLLKVEIKDIPMVAFDTLRLSYRKSVDDALAEFAQELNSRGLKCELKAMLPPSQ